MAAPAKRAAREVGVNACTVFRWLNVAEFAEEVNRLTPMAGIAARAERLRIANRAARQSVKADGMLETNRDILDWLKFAQSETEGVKLGMVELALSEKQL